MAKQPKFDFASALLAWFDQHGRKNLPWQKPITPYRVWLSEVMLQQTQVDTVIPYFERFIERFPNVEDLAAAKQDDVLHLWTGLGYYARARNLHRCAQIISEEYGGVFPKDPEALNALPGIGKSTAHAIASIAFGQATAILDGNVKRVLARFHAVPGWPGTAKIEKQLWQHADEHMPQTRCADYTQAIMDLGATLCTRSKPTCPVCPLNKNCEATLNDNPVDFPGKKPRKTTPQKETVMLIARSENDELLMEQRPAQGIWGGLWSFKEFEDTEQALTYAATQGKISRSETWANVQHVFSHFKLRITPLVVDLCPHPSTGENAAAQWVTLSQSLQLGLAAPVKKLIEKVGETRTHEIQNAR